MLGTVADPDPNNTRVNFTPSFATRFFNDWYGPFLMQPIVKGIVIVLLGIYLTFGIWGFTHVREGLKPVNLLVRDSYAIPHYETLEEYFWRIGPEVQIVVNNATDLSTAAARDEARQMVAAFTNTSHSVGEKSVQFWLNNYLTILQGPHHLEFELLEEKPWLFYRILRTELNNTAYSYLASDVNFGDPSKPDLVTSYRFSIGLKNIQSTNDQKAAMNEMRNVAGKFPERNITTFNLFWLFADQYEMILPNTMQNSLIGVCSMVVIAILLIPQPLCSIWVALAIFSMDSGVIGFMTWWGVNLDAISMITIVMSTGFCVDFSAHIAYGYVISDEELPAKRVCQTLAALGWPIVQGTVFQEFN